MSATTLHRWIGCGKMCFRLGASLAMDWPVLKRRRLPLTSSPYTHQTSLQVIRTLNIKMMQERSWEILVSHDRLKDSECKNIITCNALLPVHENRGPRSKAKIGGTKGLAMSRSQQ